MFLKLSKNLILITVFVSIISATVNCSTKTPTDNKSSGLTNDTECCLGVGNDAKVYNVPCSWAWSLDASNGHSQDTDNAIAGPLMSGDIYYAYLCQPQNGSPYIADWCFFKTQSECEQLGSSSDCHMFTAPNYQNLDPSLPKDAVHNHRSDCSGTTQ